ncbi:MAG: response regulator [Acetobacteraceae bacterium]|nr:response regulator [Acetobacteraceae bacterium]
MRTPPHILIADDNAANIDISRTRLMAHGYTISTAADGQETLTSARENRPDLILLDVMMPKLDGIEVTRQLKGDPSIPFMPIILVTARTDIKDVVIGLDAGADDYLTKPFDHAALLARVRSMLRIKALHDTVEAQREELATLNADLERRVAQQVSEIERIGRLRRFLAPQLAEKIVASGDESVFESHRREIVVLFCDLRGFTAFSETTEPEEVMAVLQGYHDAVGPLIHRHQGTLMHFMGDGLIVIFNDPMPCPDPGVRGVRLAVEMRDAIASVATAWRRRGHEIGFGIGIAQGYATLGRVGFGDRMEYTAMGTVTNLAARLCDAARDGQILVSQRIAAAVDQVVKLEQISDLSLKGLTRPGVVYQVVRLD